MAQVPLNFTPPIEPNIVALRIHESPVKDGPFVEVQRTELVGVYPDYITRFTATVNDASDWFAIQWEDADGNTGDLSVPVKGGTTTIIQELVDRMMLRSPGLDERIAAQEAEAAAQSFYGPTVDIYEIDVATVPYDILSGLTFLALARTKLFTHIVGEEGEDYTAGLISQKNTTKLDSRGISSMLALAARLLNLNYTVIMQMAETEVAGGYRQLRGIDLSRSIYEIG